MTVIRVDLRAEAAAEARRLTGARVSLRDGDEHALGQLEADGPWIATTRGARRRRALGRRVLLVWRLALEDPFGRVIESRLVPVVIELSAVPSKARRFTWIRALLRHVDADARSCIELSCGEWKEAVVRTAQAFASVRMSRERGIASRWSQPAGHAFQPGLFDRRAERARESHAAATADADRASADRRAALAQSAEIAPRPAQLLLVLVP